jgi:Cft2 family RNA processing exonuclease
MIKFIPLGGADNIGANSYYLYIEGTGILLDCGMDPREKGKDALPNFQILEQFPIDYVILSHAHHDHVGSLPFLIKKFPYVKIFATKQTQEIAALTLRNSAKILKEELGDDYESEIFNAEDVDLLIRTIEPLEYQSEVEIRGFAHTGTAPVNVELFDAGHILGSASVLISYKGKRIFIRVI